MKFFQSPLNIFTLSLGASLMLGTTGCHSYHVQATVENQTGVTLQLLEVDYPNASFGTNILAPGESFHYQFQILGTGPLQVQYAIGQGQLPQTHINGPEVHEHQEGTVQIVLLPSGKAEFHANLTPKN